MPIDLWEWRKGRVITICRPDDTTQAVPPALSSFKQAVPWNVLENMAYTYVPDQFGFNPLEIPGEQNYAWLSDIGHEPYPVDRQYSYRVQHPFYYANAMSFWHDPWQKQIPDIDPWLVSPIDLIPEDAYIEEVNFEVKYACHPTEYTYSIFEFGHDNTLLPQSTTLIPGAELFSE